MRTPGHAQPHPGRRALLALAAGLLARAPTSAACVSAPRAAAAAALAARLLAQQSAARPRANLLLSPASLEQVLAMLWLGARGTTRRALSSALDLADCAGDDAASLAPAPVRAMTSATALWTGAGVRLAPSFAAQARQCCGAGALELPADPVPAINAWVAKATQGRIERLLDQLPDGLRVLVVNAVHLRAAWAQPFDPANTTPGSFRTGSGAPVRLPFMQQTGLFQHQRLPDHSWLRMRYAAGGLALDLRVPHGDADPVHLLPALTAGIAEPGPPPARGRLALPRMAMASRNTLLPGLAAAGLGALFQPGQADFTGMVQQGGLAVDELQQSVFLALDEAGTEAAAATTASLVGALPPPALAFDLRVDRPFTFALRDERDGMPLFMGIVRDPSER